MRSFFANDVPLPLGDSGWYFEYRRRFIRKSVTLAIAIVALVPLLIWKNAVATAIYLGILVIIHVAALVVFTYRIPWRDLARHKGGLATRIGGLVIFGGLLAMLEIDAESPWFWGALTLLWFYHIAALALLHVRHAREKSMLGLPSEGCPVGPWGEKGN